jgi:serine/threonine-protein kinase
VYLAEDLKHHRKVAVKVLREDLAASLGATRFLREIEIAAQLQHPNILPLLDSGDAAGFLFYVMPYVTGQSLRERLQREGELPIHEAVRLMVEIVDALAYAHEHGVIHRDIKPDNVMLSGRHALVADFGVAKAISEATGGNAITTLGVAIGTPSYMSPEQAMADTHIDQRTDIYALGALMYELLTGRPPFIGTTPQQVLAAHVSKEPEPVGAHRPGISPPLERVVMRCLAKRAADRFQNGAELLAELEPLATPSGGITPAYTQPVQGVTRTSRTRAYAIGGAVLVVVLGLAGVLLMRDDAAINIVLGAATHVTTDNGVEVFPSISPDGKLVAYVAKPSGNYRVYVRPLGGTRTIALTDDTVGVQSQPKFSPDGSRVLFLSRGGVFAAPALGGPAEPLIPSISGLAVVSAAWSPKGDAVAFARNDSLFVTTLGAGPTRFLASAGDLYSCAWAPSNEFIACTTGNSDYTEISRATFANVAASRIVTVRVSDGTMRTLGDSATLNASPTWSPDGKTLYYVSNQLGARDVFAVNVRDGGIRGTAARLTVGANALTISLSADGKHLAYAAYIDQSNIHTIPAGGGAVANASPVALTSGRQVIDAMFVSSDGKWVVYASDLAGTYDQYRIPVEGGTPQQLTNSPADECCGFLSPDGKELAYHSYATGVRELFVKPLDGVPQMIPQTPNVSKAWPSWTHAGDGLVFDWNAADAGIVTRDARGQWSQPRLLARGFRRPQVSPDGRTIMGERDIGIVSMPMDSGAVTVLYAPRPGTTDPHSVRPRWSLDGRTIQFRGTPGANGAVTFWSIPAAGGTPTLVAQLLDQQRPSFRPDWTTDGKRFFFAINDRQSDVWVVELNRR